MSSVNPVDLHALGPLACLGGDVNLANVTVALLDQFKACRMPGRGPPW